MFMETRDIKKWFVLNLIIFGAVILVSCHKPASKNESIDNGQARKYLEPMLHNGDSVSNLVSKFGEPADQYKTREGKLVMSFRFSITNQEAIASHVCGVTAFFDDDKLSDWDPIYIQLGRQKP